MQLIIDPQTNERVYELRCHCGEKGGEIRFPENHGRESDDALKDGTRRDLFAPMRGPFMIYATFPLHRSRHRSRSGIRSCL